MRTRWLSLIFSLVILAVTGVQARGSLTLTASLNSERQVVSGSAGFFVEDKGQPLTDLRFRLYPNLDCNEGESCGIQVDSLKLDGTDLSGWAVDGTDLYVSLDGTGLTPRECYVEVWFTTQIPDRKPRLGKVGSQYTLTGWFPMLAPWRNGHWEKVTYKDFLVPAADLWDISATIIFPDSLDLIAAGVESTADSSGMTVAQVDLPAASGLPLFFAHNYKVDSTDVAGAALKIYYRDRDAFMVDTVRAAATATLEFMSDYVMPYPFDELVIVVGGLNQGGGLEQPRMILTSPPPRTTFTRLYGSMVVHEVIHQWFYGIVNSDQAKTPWLDEAVTEYFSLKVARKVANGAPDLLNIFGMTQYQSSLNRMAARPVSELKPLTLRGDLFYDRTEYYGTIYNKGILVLKTLGGLMGEESEQVFWQEYADSFKYATPQPEDFVRIANRYLPISDSADAGTLLHTTDATDFSIVSLSTDPGEEAGEEASVWSTEVEYVAKHPLGFPVDFRVEFLDGSETDTVLNPTDGWHKLEFESASPAVAAVIDPQFKYALDADYLNNSLDRQKSRGAALRVFSGVTFLVESLFSTLWGW